MDINTVDVCIVTTIHPSFDARIYERGLRSLVESGLSVCLISPWQEPEFPWLEHKWICLETPKRRIDRILHGFKTFIAAWKQPARSYHFHDIDFILWAVLLKTFKQVPVVYDCHENYPEEILYGKPWIPPYLRKILSNLTRVIEDWAAKKLGICIVVVPHQYDRFSKLGIQTVLIRNFANWKARFDLTHQRSIICSGCLSPSYGLYVLLDIGRQLKRRNLDIPLIVTDRFIGVSDEVRTLFYETVENENLNIQIHPQVKPKQMDTLLSKACIGLAVEQNSPEKRLAYPTKLFEYMAMGLPVIASDLPNSKNIVESANCGVVVPSDQASAYVDAIVNLLNDTEKFKTCQENGFKAIESIYNWQLEQNKLIEVFKSLVKNPSTN